MKLFVKTLFALFIFLSCQVNAQDLKNPSTPLINAVINNNSTLVKQLLINGVDANWMSKDSTNSALVSAVKIGNPIIVNELIPYVDVNKYYIKKNTILMYLTAITSNAKNATLLNATLNNPDIKTQPSSAQGSWTDDYLAILHSLIKGGADFNKSNDNGLIALNFMQYSGNSNYFQAVKIYIQNTFKENALDEFAANFIPDNNKQYIELIQILIPKLTDITYLLSKYAYGYTSLIEELQGKPQSPISLLFLKECVRDAKSMPDITFFTDMLRRYSVMDSVLWVRWLTHDVPLKYKELNPNISEDSIKSKMMDFSFAMEPTVLLNFFEASLVQIKSNYNLILEELLNCNPDLSIKCADEYQRASGPEYAYGLSVLDILIKNPSLQQQYYPLLERYILQRQILDINPNASQVADPETGESYRSDLMDFLTESSWITKVQYCFNASLQAKDGANVFNVVNGNTFIIIDNVSQNLGNWPKNGCGNFYFNVPYKANQPLLILSNKVRYNPDTAKIWFHGIKQPRYVRGNFSHSDFIHFYDLTKSQMNFQMNVTIPGCNFSEQQHDELPLVIIGHEYPIENLKATQGGRTFSLPMFEDTVLDRSLGSITISTTDGSELYILGNCQFSHYPELKVPIGDNEQQRLNNYLEITRLKLSAEKSALSNIGRKNVSVTIHILSEYAMQRKYLQRAFEDYKKVDANLSTLQDAMGTLNSFYEDFSTLKWENLPLLKSTISKLISSGSTAPDVKERLKHYLLQLNNAQDLADLSNVYDELFNDKMSSIIDLYVIDYQRLLLELAQYLPNEINSKENEALLLKQPKAFQKKFKKTIDSYMQISQ